MSNFYILFHLYPKPFFKQNSKHVSKRTIHLSINNQSLLLNDTDITSDDEEHIHSRIPKHNSSFTTDITLQEETYATIKNRCPILHKNVHLQ